MNSHVSRGLEFPDQKSSVPTIAECSPLETRRPGLISGLVHLECIRCAECSLTKRNSKVHYHHFISQKHDSYSTSTQYMKCRSKSDRKANGTNSCPSPFTLGVVSGSLSLLFNHQFLAHIRHYFNIALPS